MITPTHIQVLVERAENLKVKGYGETNNAFVIIQLANDKFTTSTKEKSPHSVEWMEECEFLIQHYDNSAELILKVMHNGKMKNHFLGMVSIPLKELITDFDAGATNQISSTKWYYLNCKPNKNENDNRGKLKLTISLLKKLGYEPQEDSILFHTVLNESNSHLNSNESSRSLKKGTKKVKDSAASSGANGERFWKNKNRGIYIGVK